MIPASASPLLLAGAAAEAAAYTISRSLRFNSADSAYLSRTPSSAGNRKTWTWSGWVKCARIDNGGLSNDQVGYLFEACPSGTAEAGIRFFGRQISVWQWNTTDAYQVRTLALLRDPSAWMHILVAVDSTQSTSTDRIKIYFNGVQQTQLEGGAVYPSLNFDGYVNDAIPHNIGRKNNGSRYFNGYLADVHFIDGQALDPTSFGEFDEYNNWQPKAYTGSYGTNGFKLDFSDATSTTTIAEDSSGNNNDWTANNISVTAGAGNDSLFDSPTNSGTDTGAGGEVSGNYSTWNPLGGINGSGGASVFSNGNLTVRVKGGTPYGLAAGTIAINSGKFYWEVNIDSSDATSKMVGIVLANANLSSTANQTSATVMYKGYDGSIYNQATGVSYGATWNVGDLISVALDLDASEITFYKNGSSQGAVSIAAGNWMPAVMLDTTAGFRVLTTTANFGQRPFAYDISTGISEATGAIPILSTSDDYGQTLSSGTASDSNSSSIVLALPMNGTNGGTTFTDYSATIKGSGSAKTVTAGGNAQTSTTESKWYGSSLLLDGSGDYLDAGSGFAVGTGDFTAECWARFSGTVGDNNSFYSTGNAAWTANTATGTMQFCTISSALQLKISSSGSVAGSTTISVNDWVHVAVTRESGTVRLFLNGQLDGSGTVTGNLSYDYLRIGQNRGGANYFQGNIQDFRFYNGVAKYTSSFTPPSSALFKALCTANLDEPTVPDGSTAMDVALWTGNGSTQTISGLGFESDFLWIKRRDSTNAHQLTDSVRGLTKYLFSNVSNAEETRTNQVTATSSTGFSLGSAGAVNASASPYVGWAWDAGSSTVSNTDGSITSSVRANPTAGFSIVTYTGTGVAGTIGHGLGVSPKVVLIKQRSGTQDWYYFTTVIDGSYDFLYLNLTSAKGDSSVSVPSSSVFNVGTVAGQNGSGSTYVAYCFASVEGYSAFGSYTGNGSTDGPFVFTGFRPRWLMYKRTSSTGNWVVIDSERNSFNPSKNYLLPNTTGAEGVFGTGDIDLASNGYKIRATSSDVNASGSTYIYAAFAEHPFRTSRAR